jgi:hypothetical protein
MLAALRSARADAFWVRHLYELYAAGAGRDACDVLILTPAAMQRLLAQEQGPHRLCASFVVCLDDPPSNVAEVGADHLALRDRLRAAGLALVGSARPAGHSRMVLPPRWVSSRTTCRSMPPSTPRGVHHRQTTKAIGHTISD